MAESTSPEARPPRGRGPRLDDGREQEVLRFVYGQPNLDELRGSPAAIVAAIDKFAETKHLMNVGRSKGKLVEDFIAEVKPTVMVELGAYVGYSALKFGAALRAAGGKRYYSLERNPEFAAIVLALVDLAGLSDIVKVIVGPSSSSLRRLHADGTLKKIDLLFLDHHKLLYVSDLKLCESLGLVGPGSAYAADNVIRPGAPEYLEYVRATVDQKREWLKPGNQQPTRDYDEQGHFGPKPDDKPEEGNANLIYKSKILMAEDGKDGVEFTQCTSIESDT